RMLAADPFRVGRTPVFTPADSNLLSVKDGPLAKGGMALVNIVKEYDKYVRKGGARSKFESSFQHLYYVQGRYVGVTLRTRGAVDDLVDLIKANGGTVTRRHKAAKVVEAVVPIGQADNLAADKNLMHIRPMLRPQVRSMGEGVN